MRATTKVPVSVLLLGFVLFVGTMSVAGFLSQDSFYCELLSHLRLIYILVLAACALVALATRRKLIAVIAALFVCVNLWPVSGLYTKRTPSSSVETVTTSQSTPPVKIMSLNLWGGKNRQFDQAISEIQRNNPDVIGFSEITWLWWKKLEPSLSAYPYRAMQLKYGGIAVFSRLPLKDTQIEYFGEGKRPRISAKCKMGDTYVNLLVVHPYAPLNKFNERNLELSELGSEIGEMKAPTILAGDINCSPWSFYFARLVKESGLEDSEQGFGAQPSWPAIRNHALIPIDHFLISKDIRVVNRQVGRNIGSDHLPIIVELQTLAMARKTSREISFDY